MPNAATTQATLSAFIRSRLVDHPEIRFEVVRSSFGDNLDVRMSRVSGFGQDAQVFHIAFHISYLVLEANPALALEELAYRIENGVEELNELAEAHAVPSTLTSFDALLRERYSPDRIESLTAMRGERPLFGQIDRAMGERAWANPGKPTFRHQEIAKAAKKTAERVGKPWWDRLLADDLIQEAA